MPVEPKWTMFNLPKRSRVAVLEEESVSSSTESRPMSVKRQKALAKQREEDSGEKIMAMMNELIAVSEAKLNSFRETEAKKAREWEDKVMQMDTSSITCPRKRMYFEKRQNVLY